MMTAKTVTLFLLFRPCRSRASGTGTPTVWTEKPPMFYLLRICCCYVGNGEKRGGFLLRSILSVSKMQKKANVPSCKRMTVVSVFSVWSDQSPLVTNIGPTGSGIAEGASGTTTEFGLRGRKKSKFGSKRLEYRREKPAQKYISNLYFH